MVNFKILVRYYIVTLKCMHNNLLVKKLFSSHKEMNFKHYYKYLLYANNEN